MSVAFEITRKVRERFVQVATLLYLLDPVRGEPTAYSLDQNLQNIEGSREGFLKRKFLDSFALICATKKGGDSVSAACLEEGRPEGTVIRIASNSRVSENTLTHLRDILHTLSNISTGVLDPPSVEAEVLLQIIQLDIVKIRRYMKDLKGSDSAFKEIVPDVNARLAESPSDASLLVRQQFLDWFTQIFSIQVLPEYPLPVILLRYIKWAQQAKNIYLDFLTAAFSKGDKSLPKWVYTVFKLGRYGIAARVLVQTAIELPALFNPMLVEPVPAPQKAEFAAPDEGMTLASLLPRLGVSASKVEDTISRLAGIWSTSDPETVFREAYPSVLIAHAELQITSFYDHNTKHKPSFKFIGRPSDSHPATKNYTYPGSRPRLPPPAINSQVYQQYKSIIADMSRRLEVIAGQDLNSRIGLKRLPVPADSTAGVSLTGLTEMRRPGAKQIYIGFSDGVKSSDPEQLYSASPANGTDSRSVTQSPSTTLQTPVSVRSGGNEMNRSEVGEQHINQGYLISDPSIDRYNGEQQVLNQNLQMTVPSMDRVDVGSQCLRQDSIASISSMVFHFKYLGDEKRQDIIMMSSILDHFTLSPSWSKLVELLNPDDNFGLMFNDSDVLIINGHIRVRNERQFTACLQYLLNSGILNAEVTIRDGRCS